MLDKKLQKLRYALPVQLRDFILVLNSFDRVRHACFGEKLLSSYENEIINFGNLYCALTTADNKPVEIIPKIHILLGSIQILCKQYFDSFGPHPPGSQILLINQT